MVSRNAEVWHHGWCNACRARCPRRQTPWAQGSPGWWEGTPKESDDTTGAKAGACSVCVRRARARRSLGPGCQDAKDCPPGCTAETEQHQTSPQLAGCSSQRTQKLLPEQGRGPLPAPVPLQLRLMTKPKITPTEKEKYSEDPVHCHRESTQGGSGAGRLETGSWHRDPMLDK